MSIVTLDEAKDQLNIDLSVTQFDAELQRFVDGIGLAIEEYLHEVVEQRTITERLRLRGRYRFRLWRLPVVELMSIVNRVDQSSFDLSGLDLDGETGLVEVLSGSAPCGVYTATYSAGYETVPQNIKQGALVVLEHVWETQRGSDGLLGGSVIGQEEIHVRGGNFTVPNKAKEWLGEPRPVVA